MRVSGAHDVLAACVELGGPEIAGNIEGVRLKDHLYANMSRRAGEMLRDDLEAKGPVRVSEVEEAQKEILTIARRLAEEGQIALGGSGGEEFI